MVPACERTPARGGSRASLHFASTETTHWQGYMDGAIQSGERAAAEVLEALQGASGSSS